MCLVYRTETGCVGVQLYSRLGSELATGGVVQPPVPPRTLLAPCSPSFVADCLETSDELGTELVKDAKEWGIKEWLEYSKK